MKNSDSYRISVKRESRPTTQPEVAEGQIRTHFAYRLPSNEDRTRRAFDSEGTIGKLLLQSLLPIDDYEVFICGPTPFMMAMYQLLINPGVDRNRIVYEFFGKARSLEAMVENNSKSQSMATSYLLDREYRLTGVTM